MGTTSPQARSHVNRGSGSGFDRQYGDHDPYRVRDQLSTDYTGTTNFTYFIRTTQSGGTGTIGLRVIDRLQRRRRRPFGGTSRPLTATPCTYIPHRQQPGNGVPARRQLRTSATADPRRRFGANAHSDHSAGNSASVAWALTNDPLYQTGAYTATITYTISAT